MWTWCHCRVWPAWGAPRNAPLFLQTITDPFLAFPLEPPGNSEFRSAASQINAVHVKTNQTREAVQSVKYHAHSQVSEAGVHRPHVGGIHGRSNDGSYSLVLAGGFEDEVVGCLDFCSLVFVPLRSAENASQRPVLTCCRTEGMSSPTRAAGVATSQETNASGSTLLTRP